MDVLFEYIPSVFKNRVLADYWLSEYLTSTYTGYLVAKQ